MAVKAGSFSIGSTGNGGIGSLTFLPTRIFFRMGPATGFTDTAKTSRMDGWCTASNQSYDSVFEDSTGKEQMAGIDKCIRLRYRNGGTMQDRVAASFVSFDTLGGGLYGFTLNFTAADGGYQIRYMCDDA